jgi:hypothetical protein
MSSKRTPLSFIAIIDSWNYQKFIPEYKKVSKTTQNNVYEKPDW